MRLECGLKFKGEGMDEVNEVFRRFFEEVFVIVFCFIIINFLYGFFFYKSIYFWRFF